MGALLQDLRYGLRAMRQSPGLTAVAVLSLALGIGANTAIFTLINALILRTLPVENPKALVLFGPGDASGNSDGFPDDDMNLFSYPMYREFRDKNQVFSGLAAVRSWTSDMHGTVAGSGNLEPVGIQLVSGTFFNVLGLKPVVGRLIGDADDRTLGGHPVAVASYGWWTSRFSRDPSILGKTVTLGATAYTIIGVAPPGFRGITVGDSADLWIPLQMEDAISRGPHKLNDKFYRADNIIARLKPRVTIGEASANVNLLLKGILHGYAGLKPAPSRMEDIGKAHITLHPAATGVSPLRDEFQEPLWMLMAIVGVVLLIACANIANLLLARGMNRQREIAVRMALGAGRRRVVRQLLTESVLLAVAGGALGFLIASWAGPFLMAAVVNGPHDVGSVGPLDLSPDARVLGFTLLASFAAALLFGSFPAGRSTRVDLAPSLKEGRGGVGLREHTRIGRALIVAQVALSLVLLIGAGLFVRSLVNLADVDPGFNKQNVLVLDVDSSATGFSDEAHLGNLYRQVEDRVEALPGLRAASFTLFNFNTGGWNNDAWPEGSTDQSFDHTAWYNVVGPGYFSALGLPILAGRGFGPQDTAASARVAVINETMAKRLFPAGTPVGKRFGMTDFQDRRNHDHDYEVIGVVKDSKYSTLDETPRAVAYYPYAQYNPSWGTGLYLGHLDVRAAGRPGTILSEIRQAIREVNPSLPVTATRTLSEQVDQSITYQRLVAQLSAFFGLLAVFLACIGIYGLMSYAVSRRTSEIGIRMALGAQQRDVLRMVMREIIILVAAGVLIGIPAALASGRWAASLLFGLKPTDPATLAVAVVLLLAVAALAGYLPARRASKVDPMVALRCE